MQGPSDAFRARVAEELDALVGVVEERAMVRQLVEDRLDGLLGRILDGIAEDPTFDRVGDETPEEALAGIEAWAALASAAVRHLRAGESMAQGHGQLEQEGCRALARDR